jgi:hypothetical protein
MGNVMSTAVARREIGATAPDTLVKPFDLHVTSALQVQYLEMVISFFLQEAIKDQYSDGVLMLEPLYEQVKAFIIGDYQCSDPGCESCRSRDTNKYHFLTIDQLRAECPQFYAAFEMESAE